MRWCPTAYNRCLTRDLYGYWNLYIVHRSHFECFFKTSQTNIVHHSLACWVAGVSCPILAFKKDFCPSVIFRHEYISCHEFLGEAYLHILSILHRRGVFPFTNYPGIVASVLYYTAEKQMVMWGESDRGEKTGISGPRPHLDQERCSAHGPLATVVTRVVIQSECVCVCKDWRLSVQPDPHDTFWQCVFLQLKLYFSPCWNFMFLYAQFFIFMTTLLVTTRSCLSHFHQRYWVSDARCKAVICAEVFLYIHPAMSRLWCCNARLEVWSVACQQSRLYLQHHLLHLPLWKSGQKKPVMWRWFDTFCRSDNMICSLWQVAGMSLLLCIVSFIMQQKSN